MLLAKVSGIRAVRSIASQAWAREHGMQADLSAWLTSLQLLSSWIDAPICLVDRSFTVVGGSRPRAERASVSASDDTWGSLDQLLGEANFKLLKPYLQRGLDGEHLALEVVHGERGDQPAQSVVELRSVDFGSHTAVLLAVQAAQTLQADPGAARLRATSAPAAALSQAAVDALDGAALDVQQTIDLVDSPYVRLDFTGRILICNAAFARWFGLDRNQVRECSLHAVLDAAQAEWFMQWLTLGEPAGAMDSERLESELTLAHGQRRRVAVRLAHTAVHNAQPAGLHLALIDVGAREREELALRQASLLLKTQLEYTDQASFATDAQGYITHWSARAEVLFGWQRDEALLQSLSKLGLLAQEGMTHLTEQYSAVQGTEGSQHRFLATARTRSGRELATEWHVTVLRDTQGQVSSAHHLVKDVDVRSEDTVKAPTQPNLDALTGLPNRSMFDTAIRRQIDRARREIGGVAVLFLDLDQFKNVNDTLGHRVGDQLLIEVAKVLRQSVDELDDIVRIGGDEFMILSAQSRPKAGAHRLAETIIQRLRDPIEVDLHHLSVGGSIGVAVYPDHGITPDALLRHADLAMYQAKAAGRNRFEFFSPLIAQRNDRRAGIKNALTRAISADAMSLYYQPRVRLKDNVIIGAEALLRWKDEQLGAVPPKEFIGIAEDSGLIHELGLLVLRKACVQAQDWQKKHVPFGVLAVNFSAQQLHTSTFLAEVQAVLEQTGCDPHCLEVEITETSMLSDMSLLSPVIAGLKAAGMRIAIDDFGTGFSSLSHLQRLEVDTLKIDQSFVRGMLKNSGDLAITRSVISLARALGLTVTAEGVENEGQRVSLRNAGCDFYQGFLYSPAIGAEDFEMLVHEAVSSGRSGGNHV